MFAVEWKKSGPIKKFKWNVKLLEFFRGKKIVARCQTQESDQKQIKYCYNEFPLNSISNDGVKTNEG